MKKIFSWINPKLKVKKSVKGGYGVFTSEKIKKDEVLAIFGGYVMGVKEEENLPIEFRDHGVQISENFVLTVKRKSEVGDGYFNHSCNPNAGFKGQIFLVSMRNIEKNEEITFDYAMAVHKSKGAKYYKMKCLCGSKNCRGYITEDDWKNPEIQKRYDGYFQYYLQEKINKIKNKK